MVGVRLSCSGLNLSDNNRMSSRVVSMVSNNLLISFTMGNMVIHLNLNSVSDSNCKYRFSLFPTNLREMSSAVVHNLSHITEKKIYA